MKTLVFLAVTVVLFFSSLTLGAYLEYDSSSIWAQSQSIATDIDETDDSGSQSDWSDTEATIYTSAVTSDDPDTTAECQADSMMGYTEQYDEAGGLHVYAYAYAFGETYVADANAFAYAGAAGVAPGQATGLFFKIIPDAGEQNGDTVEITLNWSGHAFVTDSGEAASNNGFLGNDDPGSGITVALNPSDKIIPPAGSRVWEHVVLEQIGDGSLDESDSVTFNAKIGDVIGVFAGVHAQVDTSGAGNYAEADSANEFTFSIQYIGGPTYTAADADIDGSGFVDLGDFVILAQFWLQSASIENDGSTCAKAIDVPDFGTIQGDNYGALSSPITSCGGDNDENAVWYKFTSSVSSDVQFTVTPAGTDELDASLALYDTCGGNEIACDEQWIENITIYMGSGETVYIRIGGWELDEGEFELDIQQSGPM